MPMHDWTRVEAGIFHAFHHRWISAISDVLNTELLPEDYYALPEQVAAFVDKACELLEHRIHLLVIDPFPPGPRDPEGIHAAIWEHVQENPFQLPPDKPLTLAAYECDLTTRAYIEPIAVSDALPEMPLFLEPNGCIQIPLETTYQTAYAVLPRRWRRVLDAPPE